MHKGPGLHSVMPETLDAHAGCRIRARGVSDHRAVRSLPVYAREEYLVIGHALLGEVEALRLVGQLVDGKLAFGEHLFPGNAQKLKQMFPEGGFGLRQQGRYFKGFARLGDIHFRAEFSFKIRGFSEGDQKHPVLHRRVWKRGSDFQDADAPARERVKIDVRGQRDRKPVGEVFLRLLAHPLLGAKLGAPPVVDRRPVEFRVLGNLVFFEFLQQLGKPRAPGLRKRHGIDAGDFDGDFTVRQIIDVQRNDEVLEFFPFGDALREMQLLERAVLGVRCPREDVEHLDSAGFDHLFDIVPEHLAAQQLREIAPYAVALVRQLQRQPQREFIVFGIGMAQQQGVALLCDLYAFSHRVSHVRKSISAYVKAAVRRLDFVKKKSQIRSITPDTASEAIAGGDNCPKADQSTIFPPAPKKTCSLASAHSRHPMAMTIPSGLAPSAFRRNPYVTLSLNSKSNLFPSSGRV